MTTRPTELGPIQVVLQDTAARLNEESEHASFVPQGNGGGSPAIDTGAENIGIAGELIAKSVREMFEAVAQRHERAATVARETGNTIAAMLEKASSGAKTAAATLSFGTETMSGAEQ